MPEKIIPKVITNNKDEVARLKEILFLILKNNKRENKENIQNLCKNDPAINSEPNGPDNLRPSALNPKRSNPTIYWKIISILTSNDEIPNDKNIIL